MIIWGSKTRQTRSKNGDLLKNACPACGDDLELYDLKQWFTLYFIPLFPYKTIDHFYKCQGCEEGYKERIRELLPARAKRVQLKK